MSRAASQREHRRIAFAFVLGALLALTGGLALNALLTPDEARARYAMPAGERGRDEPP